MTCCALFADRCPVSTNAHLPRQKRVPLDARAPSMRGFEQDSERVPAQGVETFIGIVAHWVEPPSIATQYVVLPISNATLVVPLPDASVMMEPTLYASHPLPPVAK